MYDPTMVFVLLAALHPELVVRLIELYVLVAAGWGVVLGAGEIIWREVFG